MGQNNTTQRLSWLILFGISAVFIITTIIHRFYPESSSPLLGQILSVLSLHREANVATWWSATLLLLCGLIAYEIFSVQQSKRWVWLLLAVIFASLSFDELGSIHESFGFFGELEPWLYMAPFIIVGGLLFLVAAVQLYSEPETRLSAILLVIGLGLFGFVAVQEFIEHRIEWTETLRALRNGLEEGTELLGILLCLLALIRVRKLETQHFLSAVVPNPALMLHPRLLILGGFVLHLVSSIAIPALDSNTSGHPSLWYPSTLISVSVMWLYWQYFRDEMPRKLLTTFVTLALLLFSPIMVYISVPRNFWQDIFNLEQHYVTYGTITLLLLLVLGIKIVVANQWDMTTRIVILALFLLVALSFVINTPLTLYLSSGLIAIGFTYLLAKPLFSIQAS